jgi:hypothetical protein
VRVPLRKAASVGEQRRYQLQSDRAKALPMRDAFPLATVVHIELKFDDGGGHVPSPQLHSLYPSARAFFRFACPCADCDGDFDLTPAVAALMKASQMTQRSVDRTATGRLQCQGIRFRESNHSKPCPIELSYRLVTGFEVAA